MFGKNDFNELPEKAAVVDETGEYPIDMLDAFRTYRNRQYEYLGAFTRADGVYHLFKIPKYLDNTM